MTRWTMQRLTMIGLTGLLAGSAFPDHAEAKRDFGIYGVGARVGFSMDPDQFVFGGHVDLGDIAERLQFQPVVEIGTGSDFTVITVLADFNYHLRENWEDLTPYVGLGFGPVFISNDFADDTEVGLTVQAGVKQQLSSGNYSYMGEVRVGLLDTPDFKVVFGILLGN